MTSQENRNVICPESTIESANVRTSAQKQASRNDDGLACESTIESWLRRGFIKRAALATAAIGIGGPLLEKTKLTGASAKSDYNACCDFVKCTLIAHYGIVTNFFNNCGFGINFGANRLGCCKWNVDCTAYIISGYQRPMDLQAPSGSHIRIGTSYYEHSGVGINTCCPNATLDVNGDIHAESGITSSGAVVIGKCCTPTSLTVYGNEKVYGGASTAVKGSSSSGIGVYGQSCGESCCSIGVQGYSPDSTGVYGKSCVGTGVHGSGEYGVKGKGSFVGVCATSCNIGVYALGNSIAVRATANAPTAIPLVVCGLGCANLQEWNVGCAPKSVVNKCGWIGIGTCTPSTPLDVFGAATVDGSFTALAGAAGTVPIIAKGASGQTANLQEWEGNCGTVYAVINKAGSLGLGGVTNPHHVLCISGKAHASSGFSIGPCTCINTTLAVNGSFAAKTRTVGSTSTIQTTDYAILATGTITLTLPPAKTQNGMTIFIKNISTGTISVAPGGTDTIEGATSSSPKTLTRQYDSLTLISNGSNEWYIQSGVRCGAVIS